MTSKLVAERNQKIVLDLAMRPGNDVCADCKSRNPRWASHNLGIFICMRCASIHRKIGTHITKVKSLTMDTWTKEQIEVMKQYGNTKTNTYYNPDEAKHPPPTNLMESERDSELEQYIRAKYEFKKFMPDRSAIASKLLGPSRSVASVRNLAAAPTVPARPMSAAPVSTTPAAPLSSASSVAPSGVAASLTQIQAPQRSVSHPVSSLGGALSSPFPVQTQTHPPAQPQMPAGSSWNDLISLQAPGASSSLPLQYSPLPTPAAGPVPIVGMGSPVPGMTMSSPFGAGLSSSPAGLSAGFSSSPYGTGLSASPAGLGAAFPAGGLSSSPRGLNPFQQTQLGGFSSSPAAPSPFAGMNPFQPQFATQTQQSAFALSPSPAPSFQPAPTNPFGGMYGQSSQVAPHTMAHPGMSPSPQPQYGMSPSLAGGMQTNTSYGMVGSPASAHMGGQTNPFAAMQPQYGQAQSPYATGPPAFGATPMGWQPQQPQGWPGM